MGKLAVMNAFGAPPKPLDQGHRKQAILSVGRQDLDCTALIPLAKGAEVVGASSDHMIVDISDCSMPYQVGARMAFKVGTYAALISAMASPNISKTYQDTQECAVGI